MNSLSPQGIQPLCDPAIQATRPRVVAASWNGQPEALAAVMKTAGYVPGWLWEDTMFPLITNLVTPLFSVRYVALVTPMELCCPRGDHERAAVVAAYGSRRKLRPVHPFTAFAFLQVLRRHQPDDCRGEIIIYTGDLLRCARGRPFIIMVHHSRGGQGWLSPLFTDGLGGATQYNDRWLFGAP